MENNIVRDIWDSHFKIGIDIFVKKNISSQEENA